MTDTIMIEGVDENRQRELRALHDLVMATITLSAQIGKACLVEGRSALQGLSGMFGARAAQSLSSATRLAELGFNADAMTCGRTVVEMAIDYAYIVQDHATRIPMFSAYGDVAKFKLASAVVKHGGKIPTPALSSLQARHDAALQNNPDSDFNWAGKSIRQRAIAADRMSIYEMAYAEMCTASHSCAGTLDYALVWDEQDNAGVRFGSMTPDPHPIRVTGIAMLILLGQIVTACGLDEELGNRGVALADQIKG